MLGGVGFRKASPAIAWAARQSCSPTRCRRPLSRQPTTPAPPASRPARQTQAHQTPAPDAGARHRAYVAPPTQPRAHAVASFSTSTTAAAFNHSHSNANPSVSSRQTTWPHMVDGRTSRLVPPMRSCRRPRKFEEIACNLQCSTLAIHTGARASVPTSRPGTSEQSFRRSSPSCARHESMDLVHEDVMKYAKNRSATSRTESPLSAQDSRTPPRRAFCGADTLWCEAA